MDTCKTKIAILSSITLLHVIRFTVSQSGCDDEVPMLDRLETRSVNRTSVVPYSDHSLTEGWYSVKKNGVQYVMSNRTDFQRYHYSCGTKHPITADTNIIFSDLNEEAVLIFTHEIYYSPPITYHSSGNAKIRKCHGQIQYYLEPTCFECGYCFEPLETILDECHGNESVVISGIKTELKFLHEGNASSRLDIIPYLVFQCDFLSISGRLYNVTWYLDDETLAAYEPSGDLDDLLLYEDKILEFASGESLHDRKLKCSVSLLPSNSSKGISCTALSEPFNLAAQVMKNPVILYKNQLTASIDVEFSLPVGCGYSVIHSEKPSIPCDYSLKLYMQDDWSCSKGGIANVVTNLYDKRFCTQPLKLLESASQWNGTTIKHSIDISSIDRNYDDAHDFSVLLKFDDTIGHKLWKNYTFPLIQIKIVTGGVYRNKVCYSHNDPHMRSADRNYYEQHQTGIFVMYRNEEYNIEVQQQVKPCNTGSRVCCTCGVAVQAGQDVFLINRCGRINYMDFKQCGDGGILVVIPVSSWTYRVITPIGTRIDINMGWGEFMNVDIYMAPKDERNVVGLCGKFDDDKTNDFLLRDGSTAQGSQTWSYEPTTFSKSWMLSVDNSHFQATELPLQSWSSIDKKFCICQEPGTSFWESKCSSTQDFGCENPKSITDKRCEISNRKKRSSTKTHAREKERLFALMNESRPDRHIAKRSTTQNFTADEASEICSAINNSLSVTDYSDVSASEDPSAVISQCAIDVVEMNDASMVDLHIEAMNDLVKNIIDLTPSYVANNTEKVEYFLAHSCPLNCSANGVCTLNGTCDCTGDFTGDDCSIYLLDPLEIDDIEGGGICDVSEDDCQCFTIRTDNLLEGFSCKLSVYEVTADMEHLKVWTGATTGEYLDIFTGVCCVNNEHTKNLSTSFALKYELSISNDASNYGTAAVSFIYDSTCQNVSGSGGANTIIVMLDGFCLIDNYCVEENATHTDNCSVCKPAMNHYTWTNVCHADDRDDADSVRGATVTLVLEIIGPLFGVVVFAAVGYAIWKTKKEPEVSPNGTSRDRPTTQNDVVQNDYPKPAEQPMRAWSLNKNTSKEFTQHEKNPFKVNSSEQFFFSQKFSVKTEVEPTTRTVTSFVQPLQLERQDTQGPNFDLDETPERVVSRTGGISVTDLEFD